LACQFQGSRDIVLLATLVSATEQEHEAPAPLPKINTVARPIVNAQFSHALTYRPHVTEVPEGETLESGGDSRLCPLIPQLAEPVSKDFRLAYCDVWHIESDRSPQTTAQQAT